MKNTNANKKSCAAVSLENVWICIHENGLLQATGIDAKNRKQYKYHPLWNVLRNRTKFHHLYKFGKYLFLHLSRY
jgi:DNA topoisomerase IB